MPNYLPFMLVVTLWIYAFVDCMGTPEVRVRGLPKVIWLLIVLFFGAVMVGPLAWLLLGKRRGPAAVTRVGRPAPWQREYQELRERRAAGEERHPRPGRHLPLDRFEEPDPGWVAPDDNPEFLRSLSELNKQRRKDGTASPEGE